MILPLTISKPVLQDAVSEAPAANSEPARVGAVAPRAPITATVPSNGALNLYEPEELGAEVLEAFDRSWNAGVNGAGPKNGKVSKVGTANSLLTVAALASTLERQCISC